MKLYHTKPAYLSQDLVNRIDEKWHRLKTHRPLSPTIVNKLRERFMLEMTYNSNAIEGNQLTYKETYLVINEGITIKGKSLKNHLEVKSHQEALEFIYDLVEFDSHFTLSQNLIRQIQIILRKGSQTFPCVRPGFCRSAPVNAPFSWPNSSLSRRLS